MENQNINDQMSFVRLNENGYIHDIGFAPYDKLARVIWVNFPDSFDYEHFWCYKYEDEKFIFDERIAKEYDNMACIEDARRHRAELLSKSDYLMISDYPLEDNARQRWRVYRQALRDITEQPGWPDDIIWPIKPTQ